MNSLTYLFYNAPQCPPPRSCEGLCPGQQYNYTDPISINVPVPFGARCQNAKPIYPPLQRGSHDPVFNSRAPTKSYYELGSAGNWPLKLKAKQKSQLKGKPFTGV